jgi:regulator of replication initiation timing
LGNPTLHVPPLKHGDALVARKIGEKKKKKKKKERKKREKKMKNVRRIWVWPGYDICKMTKDKVSRNDNEKPPGELSLPCPLFTWRRPRRPEKR